MHSNFSVCFRLEFQINSAFSRSHIFCFYMSIFSALREAHVVGVMNYEGGGVRSLGAFVHARSHMCGVVCVYVCDSKIHKNLFFLAG